MRYYFLLSRVIHGSAGIVDDSVKVVQIQVPKLRPCAISGSGYES
jgi:hypothetical protein